MGRPLDAYWQDVLAENPNIVNPTLNNTGPFRWWIHESFVDNKPFDRFVTELVLMEGSERYGGTAGFAVASQNDAPNAAKAGILAQGLLGMNMKCARCHDAPYHDFSQKDLFELAALIKRDIEKLPKTSTVTVAEGARKPLVKITLKPGEEIKPAWPFEDKIPGAPPEGWIRNPKDTREQLAAWLTSPSNDRFSEVVVNRLWQRYMGRESSNPSMTGSMPSRATRNCCSGLSVSLSRMDTTSSTWRGSSCFQRPISGRLKRNWIVQAFRRAHVAADVGGADCRFTVHGLRQAV